MRRHSQRAQAGRLLDTDQLKYNADGALDIHMQNESPGRDKESNWLPFRAEGEVDCVLRLYVAKLEILTGKWNPPPIRRIA